MSKSVLEICNILISRGHHTLNLDTGYEKLIIHWDSKQISLLYIEFSLKERKPILNFASKF
jgi:hypothetical protein